MTTEDKAQAPIVISKNGQTVIIVPPPQKYIDAARRAQRAHDAKMNFFKKELSGLVLELLYAGHGRAGARQYLCDLINSGQDSQHDKHLRLKIVQSILPKRSKNKSVSRNIGMGSVSVSTC